MKKRRKRPRRRLVLDEIKRVSVLKLAPDDILVAMTDLMLDKDQLLAVRERLSEQAVVVPNKILVLTAGLKLAVLRKVEPHGRQLSAKRLQTGVRPVRPADHDSAAGKSAGRGNVRWPWNFRLQ